MNPGALRVVVVDEDQRVHQLFGRVLRLPEFEASFFADPCAALVRLAEIGPAVIVCALEMDAMRGSAFHRAVRATPQLAEIPFLFLYLDPDAQHEVQTRLGPHDECLRKPFPVAALLERVRRIGRSRPQPAPRSAGSALSGWADRSGLFGLLKLCEDARLTGRLTIETADRRLWVDWLAGALAGAGAAPIESGEDALELLLDLDGGRYGFEPQPVQARQGPRRGPAGGAGGPGADPARTLLGRFTNLEVNGRRLQVYTEPSHAPNFVITTVVATSGRGVRKVENCWPHPLKRTADYDVAREEINRQHESVLAMVRDGALAPPHRRTVWDVAGGGVEGELLIWVMSLLRELTRERLGTAPALALLRRSLKQCAETRPALRGFHVDDEGHVGYETSEELPSRTTLSGWRVPKGAIEGVAAWALAFHAEVSPLAGQPRMPSLRRATRMLAEELKTIGFYDALREEEAVR